MHGPPTRSGVTLNWQTIFVFIAPGVWQPQDSLVHPRPSTWSYMHACKCVRFGRLQFDCHTDTHEHYFRASWYSGKTIAQLPAVNKQHINWQEKYSPNPEIRRKRERRVTVVSGVVEKSVHETEEEGVLNSTARPIRGVWLSWRHGKASVHMRMIFENGGRVVVCVTTSNLFFFVR